MMRLLATDVARMQDVAAQAVKIAQAVGADQAVATARANAGIKVTARMGETDTALRDAGQGLTLTLYRGARAGTATTAALDPAAIRRAAEEAFAIADLVGEDADSLPPSLAQMAVDTPLPPIDAPSGRDPASLRALALEGDALLRGATVPGVMIETIASGVLSSEGGMALATSAGFCRGEIFSFHSAWLVALARDAGGAVNDSADSQDRRFDSLEPMAVLAERVIARATGKLGARTLPSQRCPVLFEARVATALIGDLVGALSGNPQQRGTTFLPDALGKTVAAPHLDLMEDPFEPYGLASGGFDREGVAGSRRAILNGGVVEGLFLGTRSARRLGMTSTGNADGPWNLRLASRAGSESFETLCRQMGRGLIVRGLTGGATDPVSGNWTYAVVGTWVEDGVLVHAVADVTVGGNMRDMLMGIVAVGDDMHRAGAVRTGSILIDGLQIGGAA
ncbi:metallopeptidase TldD-related protein [Sphingobium sp. HBC34]|uniref:Metallopeptidase TldD-related protein n=1 Tax=Sphingobium cyanobacteriorum TaxID=3063954 RepID=A0ABT8ZUD2_9SPHN|nr:metallopeptidase TldD-related protein [Sphingobium sp. HBC34]MDO7837071.1 metallopeptidase TldD-related protein [Sphingobium sp. HBC34]